MQIFFRQTLILVWKDILIDLQRKDNLLSMLLFAILALLVFQFAMGKEPEMFLTALPGVIWIVTLMSGVLGLGKSFVQEMESGCMGALLIAPVDRSVLFLGKMLANTMFLLLTQLLFVPLCMFIFEIDVVSWTGLFLVALPGVIWIVTLMSGVLGLGKSFVQEMESGCMGALLIAPVDRSVLFLGKMLANTMFLLLTQLLFVPLCLFIFEIDVLSRTGLFLVLLFGTIGFSSLGTLLTVMTSTVRGKEILLPILIFPLMVPSLLCVVRLMENLFFGLHQQEVWSWWKLLVGFDIVLFTLTILGFEFVVEE